MRNPVIALYKCAQKDLYSVCRTGWKNFQKNLGIFASKKALYDAALATAALSAVDAAEALPDADARAEDGRTLHVQLEKDAAVCLTNFQFTKSYIDSAYPADVRKIKYDAAGQGYYGEAGNGDWESVSNLNASMIGFLNEHDVALEAGDNMPATFIGEVTTSSSTFSTTYTDFKDAEETGEATDAKVTANNACYTTLMSMMKDGQLYFKDKPQFDLFVFEALLEMINPTVASFAGLVTETNFTAIGGVSITLSKAGSPPIAFVSNADGSFDQGKLAAGDYAVLLQKDGYNNVEDTITLVKGIRLKKDYVMERV